MLMPPSRIVTLPAALRDLRGGSVKARVLAADVLGDVTGDDRAAAVEALRAALEDDVAEVRAEAATSLGIQRDAGAVAALIKRLDDGHPLVRQAAAIALGTLGDAQAFTPLAAVLRDGPADLRFQAATSLAEIDPVAAFSPLCAALHDPDAQVVGAVALALGATGDPRAPGHLARLLEHDVAAVRFDAAYALAQLHDRRGRATLEAALVDGARNWDAVCALEELGDAAATPALAALLGRKATSPQAQVRAASAILELAAKTASASGAPPATDRLARRATSAAPAEQESRSSRDLDGVPEAAAARACLLAALDHRKLDVRGLAVESLGAVGGAWAVAPLAALRGRRKGREVADAIAAALDAIGARS